ncbi:MAG TPA: AAA family ATPase [Candidatus Bathyarchaeia archaeon]|nr:AAA family ATPase [Candidatus Bathyarchaeia archaeon]
MIKRHISEIAFSRDFGRQMRFIIGPRQTGKTTVAKEFLKGQNCLKLYYNWDDRKTRDLYIADYHFFVQELYNVTPSEGRRWLCMDEIHKYLKWKNVLKDFFDSFGEENGFIVTGSARLDMMRKSGDSLAGRYFTFRLNPVTLRELMGEPFREPPAYADDWIMQKLDHPTYKKKELSALLRFSGFPEPLLSASVRFCNKWRTDYVDRLIREDMRDLTRIQELENVATLMYLLPSKIASPLSINSLTADIKCSFATVSNYLKAMELGYLIFRILPYSKKIARSLTKENKVYFFDWTRINDPAAQFENYMAVELKTLLELWTDAGIGNFDLHFIRDRDGKETDFLILRENEPWLMLEAKFSHSTIDYHHRKNRNTLGGIPFIQVVRQENIAEKREDGLYQMSASRFFA